MRKLLFLTFLAAFSFTACKFDKPVQTSKFTIDAGSVNNRGEPKITAEQKTVLALNTHIDKELNSGKEFKEVFPGYSFGMKEKQIQRTNKKMARKGNVQKYRKVQKRSYAYAYLMPLVGGDTPTFFDFDFNAEGKMFKGTGVIVTPSGSNTLDILNVTVDKFTEWFGEAAFDLPSYNACARKVWVNGNRLIDLRCELEGVTISFYNLKEEMPDLFNTNPTIESEEKNPLIEEGKEEVEQTMEMAN